MGPFLLISFVDVSLQKRQLSKRKVTPQVVPQGLQECTAFPEAHSILKSCRAKIQKFHIRKCDFTPTPGVPLTSPGPKSCSIPSKPIGLPIDFTRDLQDRLRTLCSRANQTLANGGPSLSPIIVVTTRGAGITAAAGTRLVVRRLAC